MKGHAALGMNEQIDWCRKRIAAMRVMADYVGDRKDPLALACIADEQATIERLRREQQANQSTHSSQST